MRAHVEGGVLRPAVSDDGVGGAVVGGGSGLIGLQDRVEVLGGSLEVDSPHGVGTTLIASIRVKTMGRDRESACGHADVHRAISVQTPALERRARWPPRRLLPAAELID